MELILFLFVLAAWGFVFALFGFWIWMIIDCATQETFEGNDKVVWMLIVIFLNWLGALIYYFVRRRKRVGQVAV